MAKPLRAGGWLLLFVVAGTLGGLFVWLDSDASDRKNSTAAAPFSNRAAQPRSSPALAATPSHTPQAPKDAVAQAPVPQALPLAAEEPRSRWMEGETLWSSPLTRAADDTLRRVRLLKTTFKHPLVRVEEELAGGEAGIMPTIVNQNAVVADHLLVKTVAGTNAERLAEAVGPLGISVMSQLPGSDVYLLKIASTDGESLPQAVKAVSSLDGVVAYAGPDPIVHATVTPNDPEFWSQWSLHNNGQNTGNLDTDIDAPDAWELSTGSSAVVVAVVDSGISLTHPDLTANLWTNPGEIAGNGVDDDGNGYIDDTRGWNFISGGQPADDQAHGTHVSGIIGATGNNNVGISGVAWQVRLMPLKFLNASGLGATSDAIAAINYARTKGAHIINHSWGGQTFSQPLKDAIDAAGAAGILHVCAADNGNGRNEDVTPNYPSGYDSPTVLAVANTTNRDALDTTSDFGPTTVDLGAPGINIMSTLYANGYGPRSGTSMATPHVSGIAALVKAYRPLLTAGEIKDIILSSVDVFPALKGKVASEGRANAVKALEVASTMGVLPAAGLTAAGFPGGPFSPAEVTYTLKNYRATALNWTATLPDAPWATMGPASGTLAPGATAEITVALNSAAAAAPAGAQARVLTITDTTNNQSITRPVTLDVRIPHIYSFNLDTDPGWPREGWWQFGVPLGRGGTGFQSNKDPASAATGTNVLGVFLAGNPPPEPGGKRSLTAGPFDLRGYTGTTLKYQRWLNTSRPSIDGEHTVEISNDGGATWNSLWTDISSSIYDITWKDLSHTLGSRGDNQASVLIRWTYTTAAEETRSSSGWNIDDIQIVGTPGNRVFFTGPPSAVETEGTATLVLHVEPPSTTPLTINLASANSGAANVPASVVVPAHTTVVNVPVTLIDDAVLDGTQTAVLTPDVPGYACIPWPLAVTDNETTTLSLALPASATEGNPYLQGVLTLANALPGEVRIPLASSDSYHLGVPATVLVPAGRTRVVFPITAPQNRVDEGPRTIEVSATMPGWTSATASIVLVDDDASTLTVGFPLSAGSYHYAEGVATTSFNGTATLQTRRQVDTVISLSHDGGGRLTLPASVTIPAGALSAAITPIVIADDALQNGVARITVTAIAPGVPATSTPVSVADNEVSALAFDLIATPQVTGATAAVVLRALDVNGDLAAGYGGAATISGLNSDAADAGFTNVGVTLVKGLATANVTLPTVSTSYALRGDSGGASGTSNSFAVGDSRVRTVNLAARDLVYDPATNRLYAGTSSGTIVPIHPVTGMLEAPITVATTAVTKIRVSASGGMLHALVDNATRLVPVDLTTRTVGTPFGFGSRSGVPYSAVDFAVVPGMANTVLVSFYELDQLDPKMSVFINGVRATFSVFRSALGNPGSQVYHYLATGSQPNRVYACGGNKLFVLNISSTGASVSKTHVLPDDPGTIDCSGTSVVGRTGRVFDGETGALVGRLKANEESSRLAMMDTGVGRAAVVANPPFSPFLYDLCFFETTRFSETSRIRLPVEPTYGTRITRFGTNGMACLGASQVMLVTATELPDPAAPRADVAISQLPGPVAPLVGANLSFSLLVRNDGNATAENVVVTDRWPLGARFVTASTTRGTFAVSEEAATFQVGTLAQGEMATLTVTVKAQTGTVSNTARVTTTSAEPYTLNNTSTSSATSVTYNGTTSYGRMFNLGTTDMVSMKSQRRLLAAAGANAGFFAGTVAVIDPDRWAIVAFVPVGSDTGSLVLAEDESMATVALNSSGNLVPFNPLTYGVGQPYNLGPSADGRNFLVNEMVAVPGRPDRLAIARRTMAGTGAGAAVYQGGLRIGTATAAGVADDSLAFGVDGTQLFGHSATSIVRMGVAEAGLSVQATGTSLGEKRRIRFGSGRIVCSSGDLINPASLARTGGLADISLTDVAICLDPPRGRIFAAGVSSLYAYEDNTCTRVGGISASGYGGEPTAGMVRWGNTGVAFHRQTFIQAWDLDTFVPLPVVSVILPGTMAENAGTFSGTLQLRGGASSLPLTVSLQSTLPAVVQVPATVTLAAGELTTSFNITITDDDLLNGARQVSVIPSGAATHLYETGSAQVTDDETPTFTLSLPATLAENAGVATGQASVALGRAAEEDVVVQLASSDTSILTVPATVTIPYGASSAMVTLSAVNDTYLRGNRSVSVTASVAGWTADTETLTVTDDETAVLSFSRGAFSVTEQGGFPFVSVSVGGNVLDPVEVTFTSSHPDRLVAYSTTIPRFSQTASVMFNAIGNTLQDGRQEVTITATAPGFTPAILPVTVIDDELGGFTWSIPASVAAGASMNVTAYSRTIDGDPVTIYPAPTFPLAASRGGTAVPMITSTPLVRANPYPTDYSMHSGSATLVSAGPDTVFSIVHNGVTYTSPPFTVEPGPHASFVWDAIDPALPQPGVPFPVTVKAADVFGNWVKSFSGTASLSAAAHVFSRATGTDDDYNREIPLTSTLRNLARYQIVYLPSEVGPAGRLRSISLQLSQPSGRAHDKYTIRAKHTTRAVAHEPTGEWDNTGWTLLKQGPLSFQHVNGWVTLPLDVPFDYNGSSNLILDISFQNTGTAVGGGRCACTYTPGLMTQGISESNPDYGDPLLWDVGGSPRPFSTSYNSRPNMRFGFGTALTVSPSTTESFVDGGWSGNVTIASAGGDVKLTAMSGTGAGAATKSGDSGFFDVGAVAPPAPVLPPLSAFAAGTSIALAWDAVSVSAGYYVEVATESSFAAPVASSGWISTLGHTFTGLPGEGRYHVRAKARKGVHEGAWSNIVSTTLDNTGPVLALGNGDTGDTTTFTTTRSTWTIAGRVSDLTAGMATTSRFVRVASGAGYSSASYNLDGTWAFPLSLGSPGSYSYTISGSDVLGNSAQRSITVIRKADTDSNGLPDDWQADNGLPLGSADSGRTADFDRDGRSNLLEYAFNTAAANSSAGNAYPNMAAEVFGEDGNTYLIYRYDRRRGAVDLTYNLEFSTDLSAWSGSTFQTAPTGAPVLNADGVTERVSVRILPDISLPQAQKVFVRMGVTSLAP